MTCLPCSPIGSAWGPSDICRRLGAPTADAEENRPRKIWCDPAGRSTVAVACWMILFRSRRASLPEQARDYSADAVSTSRSRERREARWMACRPEPGPLVRSILCLCKFSWRMWKFFQFLVNLSFRELQSIVQELGEHTCWFAEKLPPSAARSSRCTRRWSSSGRKDTPGTSRRTDGAKWCIAKSRSDCELSARILRGRWIYWRTLIFYVKWCMYVRCLRFF